VAACKAAKRAWLGLGLPKAASAHRARVRTSVEMEFPPQHATERPDQAHRLVACGWPSSGGGQEAAAGGDPDKAARRKETACHSPPLPPLLYLYLCRAHRFPETLGNASRQACEEL